MPVMGKDEREMQRNSNEKFDMFLFVRERKICELVTKWVARAQRA